MKKFFATGMLAFALVACGGDAVEEEELDTMEETVPAPAPAPAPMDTAMMMDTTVLDADTTPAVQ